MDAKSKTHDLPVIKANTRSIPGRKPVLGVGISDAPYVVQPVVGGKQIRCPIYLAWYSMLSRCYDQKLLDHRPTYKGCLVAPEWLSFMAFRSWMVEQDWQGLQLDKDILVPGNKVYGPDTCVFVTSQLNNLLLDSLARRGEWPRGVRWSKQAKKFLAEMRINGKKKYLGLFDTQEEASLCYRKHKRGAILEAALAHPNPRVRLGLLRHAQLFHDDQEHC